MSGRRIHLDLSAAQLKILEDAVDNALNVPAAMAVAETQGRAPALQRLKGERVMREALSEESVATRRDLDLVIPLPGGQTKKRKRAPRPGRPTGWPSTKADRDSVNARTLELQAYPERRKAPTEEVECVRLVGASNCAAYPPTDEEMAPLCELTLRVADAAGIDLREMTTPYALATCVDGDAGWMRLRNGTTGVSVSLTDGTASLEFRSSQGHPITPAPLSAGQALVYDPSGDWRLPSGDWRRTISYDLPS